ncbi:MAG TPA: branched-chain amino acid transport system II carrier protein [Sporosarcina sp.]|nr:branched-chain amino acid transport system II carrier protein [Sporosarcina sp.]
MVTFYNSVLPLYSEGLGWLLPVVIVMIVTSIIAKLFQPSMQYKKHSN